MISTIAPKKSLRVQLNHFVVFVALHHARDAKTVWVNRLLEILLCWLYVEARFGFVLFEVAGLASVDWLVGVA